jgi:hypothetical protein
MERRRQPNRALFVATQLRARRDALLDALFEKGG